MQLYALNGHVPVLASEAVKQKNYHCPECHNLVRLRGGLHRQFHFYHLQARPSCRQHLKSLPHLQLQLHLKSLIPNSSLEKPFPSIGRIADVSWDAQRIVFEIQCSPISEEEAKARCEDYSRAGYTAVWILYDRQFNRRNLSAAENFLRSRLCYFAHGTYVYDQIEVIREGTRLYRGPQLPVNLTLPAFSETGEVAAFSGDLKSRPGRHQEALLRLEKKITCKRRFSWKKLYLTYFHALLEKFSV